MKLILVIFGVLLLVSCASQPVAPVVTDEPIPVRSVTNAAQGWRLVDKGALLIDVRDPEVFAHSHLADAINIPLPELVSKYRKFKVNKKQLIVVYGSSASRAGVTRALLARHGYANAHDAGSFDDMLFVRPYMTTRL